jgi:hypothetical protein
MSKKVVGCVLLAMSLAGCDTEQNSRQIESNKQEELSKRAVTSVGLPAITNFAEKRMMKDILELRDQNTPTVTYLVGMENQLTKLCDSVGFGLPYATQYTNPQQDVYHTVAGTYTVLPQADPNGLYSPEAADGTWVLCVDHKDGKAKPLYVEPRIIVSPIELK